MNPQRCAPRVAFDLYMTIPRVHISCVLTAYPEGKFTSSCLRYFDGTTVDFSSSVTIAACRGGNDAARSGRHLLGAVGYSGIYVL